MQVLNVTALAIYLPYDNAPVPFGDPLSDVSITVSTVGCIVSAVGYNTPKVNDAIAFSTTSSSAISSTLVMGATYYVQAIISTANGQFTISTAKGGVVASSLSSTTAGKGATLHLLSNQVDGSLIPFKTGGSVVAINMSGQVTALYQSPDLNTTTYGNPQGPNTAIVTTTSLNTGAVAMVQLSNDWIYASSGGNVVLLQN